MDQGQVWSNGNNYSRGTQNIPLALGQEGGLLANEIYGKYWHYVKNGYGFWYSSAATGIILAAVAATNQFTIWNTSTTVLFQPVFVLISYVSGTTLAGGLSWNVLNPAGYNLGTSAPFSVFTNITPTNALIGSGPPLPSSSQMRFSTTNTATAAATFQGTLGWSVGANATDLTNFAGKFEFDGCVALGPGTAMTISGTVASQAGQYAVSLFGLELPLNA